MNRQQILAAEWLRKARFLDREIAELSEAKITAWEQATKITAMLSGMPGAASKDPHKLDKFVALPGNISELLEKRAEIRKEILTAIDKLEDAGQRAVLIARYINNKPWQAIAIDMGLSAETDTVFRIHRKALDELYTKNTQKIIAYHSKS